MVRKLLPLLPIVLALMPQDALAFKHTYQVWCDANDMPLPYFMSTYQEDSVPEGYQDIALQNGFDEWTKDAPCAGLGGVYMGTSDNTTWRRDGENHETFDDPGDANAAGVLAATVTLTSGNRACFVRDGSRYLASTESDIVFNDNVDFATEDQIANNTCHGEVSMQAVATHEIGHTFGLGHSCDEGDACTSADLRDATMFWTSGPCDSHQTTIGADDIEGINRLYGPSAAVECSNELDPTDPNTIAFGVVPFDLKCSVSSDNRAEINPDTTTWSWGDGQTSTGLDTKHTYSEAGNFTVQTEIHGANNECGDWTSTSRRVGYVRACDVPAPDFTYSHLNGLTYTLMNNTDVSVYGCIYDIEWDIFPPGGGDPVKLKAWEPQYTFPEAGDYRVVLNIGGPAGTGAAELVVTAKNTRGEGYGCDSSGAPLGLALIGLAGLAVRRRRV